MHRNTWTPLLLAVAFQGFSVILALGLPETLPIYDSEYSNNVCSTSPVTLSSQGTSGQSKLDSKWATRFRRTLRSFGFVTRDKSVAALVFTFLISKVGRRTDNVLFQYVSKRYGWTLSQASLRPYFASYSSMDLYLTRSNIQAGLLLSLRAGVNIALFTIILPSITTFALSRTSAASRDLWIGQASIVLLILGSCVMFSSETAVFMIIGKERGPSATSGR